MSYVFEKVNSTSKALSKNEIWKCIYYGKIFTELEKLYNNNLELVREWFGVTIDKDDFIDMMLQLICMISGQYKTNLSNSIMVMLQKFSNDDDFADKWVRELKIVLSKGKSLFNLKKILDGPTPSLRRQILVSFYKIHKFNVQMHKHQEDLNNRIIDLFSSDNWLKYSSSWTTKDENVFGRLNLFDSLFGKFINDHKLEIDEKRFFQKRLKRNFGILLIYTYALCVMVKFIALMMHMLTTNFHEV